jgi:hypothetical protein
MPKKLTTGERIAAKWHKEAGKFDDTGKLAALIDAAVRKAAWDAFDAGEAHGVDPSFRHDHKIEAKYGPRPGRKK